MRLLALDMPPKLRCHSAAIAAVQAEHEGVMTIAAMIAAVELRRPAGLRPSSTKSVRH
jgi:hypothetical protein